MTKRLVEDFNVYIDDDTGDEYIWDGSRLILVKKGSKEIGNKGDEEIQAREEEERNRQAQEEGGVFEKAEETEARLKKIEQDLESEEFAKSISDEARERKTRAELKKEQELAEKELERFRQEPIMVFAESLRHFIRRQIEEFEEETYAKFNKRYDDPDIIMKGRRSYEDPHIPTVQVYFDRSGSWGEDKTAIGRQAIATLDKYVREKKLKVSIAYFNSVVFDTYIPDGRDGTYGSPILIDIVSKHPDNVIVMTDSDITDCKEFVEVPGVVWFLFKGGVSDNLIKHLRGKRATEVFEL